MTIEPTTRRGLNTRTKIIRAGRQVFAREGFVAAKMSDVVALSGQSTGSVYRYFRNKEDLFSAVVGDIHEELFQLSRSPGHDFASEPYEALLEANRGYLAHYSQNRDVMRSFMEAAAVDPRFRETLWMMRRRHVDRFLNSLRRHQGVKEVSGVDATIAAEAMACMMEHCAYVWFGHEELRQDVVEVETAARLLTRTWYRTFFGAS